MRWSENFVRCSDTKDGGMRKYVRDRSILKKKKILNSLSEIISA
jgi:hypothetical protein